MQTKNYLKIGLAVSLAAHVGFFALGGYVMNNMTQSLNSQSTQDMKYNESDITYVDVQVPDENNEDIEIPPEVPAHSEVTVAQENIEAAPETKPLEEAEKPQVQPAPAPQQEHKPKYRKLSDLHIPLGKIDESQYDFIKQIQLDMNNLENLKSYNPTIKKSAEPVYDHDIVPEGEEIFVIVEYIMDDNGKIIQADFKYSSSDSYPDLSPEEAEDLDYAALEALQKFEIIPPKDKDGNIVKMPYQQKFKFTHDGAVTDTQEQN